MKKQVLFAIILSLVLTASTAAQGLATQKVLTLQAAKDLAAVADKFAQSKGWTVNIAIVDAPGRRQHAISLLHQLRARDARAFGHLRNVVSAE